MHLPFFLKRPLAATDLEPVGSNPDKTWTRRLVLDVQQKWHRSPKRSFRSIDDSSSGN